MEGHALCTLGSASGAQWVDEQHILFATGNGLVRQHLESGSQVHLWGTANRQLGGSGGTPLFCCNPAGQIAALTQNGTDASIHIVTTGDLSLRATVSKDGSKELSWHALSFSHDGSVLASVSAFPDHVLDLWDTSSCKEPGKVATSGHASLTSMCHVRLGPRLSSLQPVFFPLNSHVVAVAGQQAVRVIVISAIMGGHTVQQADVDVSALHVDEHLTSMAWAPTGSLLLGTSAGRVLSVANAAPCGVVEHHWGMGDLYLQAAVVYMHDQNLTAGVHANHQLYDMQGWKTAGILGAEHMQVSIPTSANQGTVPSTHSQNTGYKLGKVAAIYCLQGHVLLACDTTSLLETGNDEQQPSAQPSTAFIWLGATTLSPTAIRNLPGSVAETYSLSPDLTTLLITNQAGDLLLADCTFGVQPNQQPMGDEHGVSATIQLQDVSLEQQNNQNDCEDIQDSLQTTVNTRLIASSHAGRASTVLLLPGKVVVTGGHDGIVRVWSCQTNTTAADVAAAGPDQKPSFALTSELTASWSLGSPITHMVNYMDTQVFAVGTANGQLHILSIQKLMELVNSGSLACLPASFTLPHNAEAATATCENVSYDEVKDAMAPVWAQQPFEGPVTSIAFAAEGTLCAVSSASDNMVAFYKVASIGTSSYQVSLHFQGFYAISSPQLLAFSPKDVRSQNTASAPLLVVSTTNGELQVLKAPDSLSHLRKAGAMIPANSLLVALLRVSSVITAMVTQPAQLTGNLDDVGSFWLFACCTDKSIRRLRLPTQQHKAAAQAAITASEQPARSLSRQDSSFAQQHRRLSISSVVSAPVAVTAPQNFQIPETERSQDLASPACHAALSGNGQALLLTTQCGTTYVYTLPDLGQVMKWQLHAPLPVEETAVGAPVCMLTSSGDVVAAPPPSQSLQHARAGASALSQNLLTTVGVDGCLQIVLLSGEAGVPRPRRPPSSRTGVHPGAKRGNQHVAMHARMSAPPGLDCLAPGAGAALSPPPHYQALHGAAPYKVLTWREAQLALQANSAANVVKAASEALASKTAAWSQQLEELRRRNRETDDGKLEPHEFVVDRWLQQQLLAEGQAKVSAMKAVSTRQCVEPQIVLNRLSKAVLQDVEESARHDVLAALPEHTFISSLSVEDMKRWREQAPHVAELLRHGVNSYPLRKLTALEEKMLKKVKYLRLVEQQEMPSWPAEGRGQIACIKRWHGPMVSAVSLTRGVSSVGASQQPTPRMMTRQGTMAVPQQSGTENANHDESDDELDVEAEVVANKVADERSQDNTMDNGLCGLLYTPLQLHCMTRKAAQATLLMEEVRAVQRAFNDRFIKLRARKTADIDRLAEKASRIAEIQKALKITIPPCSDYYHDSLEQWQDKLVVHDSEVKVDRWVSPEERARRDAAAKQEEEDRLRAQADDARQRALRDMMNSNPEVRPAVEEEEGLKREPWMDLPRTQLTAEQRSQLTEWEKAAAEAEEKQEKTRIALEAERKGLEIEMADIVIEFNHQLAALASARIQLDTSIKSLELQALDCALAHDGVQAARCQARQLAAQQGAAASEQKRHARLAASARACLQQAYKEYEGLAAQERALDKAVKRELGSKDEDVWEIVQRIYKDRSRPVRPGNPGRPAAELLGKIPEAAAVNSKLSKELTQHGSTVQETIPWTAGSENTTPEPPCLLELTNWQRQIPTPCSNSGASDQPIQVNDMQAVQQQCIGAEQAIVLTDILNQKHVQRATNAHGYASEHAGRILNAGPGRPVSGDKIQRAPAAAAAAAAAAGPIGQDSAAPLSHLETLTRVVGHRSLSPALSRLAQGQPIRSPSGDVQIQGVELPGASTLQDPYSSPQACATFSLPPESHTAATKGNGSHASQQTSSTATSSSSNQQMWHKTQHEVGPPYSLADKPDQLEEVWWLRLMDMRDARIQLEKDADSSWGRLAWAALICDNLEQTEHITGGKLDDLSEALSLLPHITEKCLLDVLLTYRLQNGQVEVPCPGDPVLANTSNALLLHRWHVERANTAVQDAGAEKLSVLQDIKGLAASIHMAQWGVARAELRRTHARAELTDLQLLHVTKDLQAVLRDPSALTRLDAAKQLEGRIAASAASHASKVGLKAMELTKLTQRLAQTAREHHDLEGATIAAQATAEESKRVRGVIARADVEQENAHKRAFRAIVENSQLKDIAASQAAELESLAKELSALRGRIFPMLADKPRPVSAFTGGPDLHSRFAGIPSVHAQQQSGPQRPFSVPANKSRPMWKTATPAASRPSSGVMLKSVSRALEPLKPGTGRGNLAPLMTTLDRSTLPPRPNSVAAAMTKLQNDSKPNNVARPDSVGPVSLPAAERPQSVGPITRANNITHVSRPSSVPLGRRRQE